MNAAQFQECIRHLLCMNAIDFLACFGDDRLWGKYRFDFKGDAAKFICYLDNGNMKKLKAHFDLYLQSLESFYERTAPQEEK